MYMYIRIHSPQRMSGGEGLRPSRIYGAGTSFSVCGSRRRSIVTFCIIYVVFIDDTLFVTTAGLWCRKIVVICGSRRRSIVTLWIVYVMNKHDIIYGAGRSFSFARKQMSFAQMRTIFLRRRYCHILNSLCRVYWWHAICDHCGSMAQENRCHLWRRKIVVVVCVCVCVCVSRRRSIVTWFRDRKW